MDDSIVNAKYCFDTSAFVNGWRLHYKPVPFSALWEHIGKMMKDRTIIVPEEVQKEIGVGTDDLVIWFKQFKICVVPISQEQLNIVSKIVNKYPLVSQYKKPRPFSADAFVVAVAKLYGCTVVTYETPDGNITKPKIPILCKELQVNYCNLATFFEKEGMTFNVK
jgi:hypothetical protein